MAIEKLFSYAEELFWKLYRCPFEGDVERILKECEFLNSPENWRPYGGNKNNYGVVDNQQASPIPALVEKLTNGIDAILEKRCLEEGKRFLRLWSRYTNKELDIT